MILCKRAAILLLLGVPIWNLFTFQSLTVDAQETIQPLEISPNGLAKIQSIVTNGIAEGEMPGCVICVGRSNRVLYLQAFGNKQVEPTQEPMTIDTVFDLASLTKPIATATSIMVLVDGNQLKLSDRVADYFPEFAANGKADITIQHLLIHQSGLIPDNALSDYQQGPDEAWRRICQLSLVGPVGETFKYSDVNFIVLGKIVEKVSGVSLDVFSTNRIFQPLGMQETAFALEITPQERFAPTGRRNDRWIRGEVHDPRAFALDGVAGHAGLFSTASDLAIYAQMLLQQGQYRSTSACEPVRIFSPDTFKLMTDPYPVSSGIRGLGWDKMTGYSSNRGSRLSERAFGHGGFTGTVLWIDPQHDLFFIFLSNRLHPDDKGNVNPLSGSLWDEFIAAFQNDL